MLEMDKLQAWLIDHKISYNRVDRFHTTPELESAYERLGIDKPQGFGEWHQIVALHDDGTRWFDVVCHYGSYGYERGLLEMMFGEDGDAIGWLTAEDVIARLEV